MFQSSAYGSSGILLHTSHKNHWNFAIFHLAMFYNCHCFHLSLFSKVLHITWLASIKKIMYLVLPLSPITKLLSFDMQLNYLFKSLKLEFWGKSASISIDLPLLIYLWSDSSMYDSDIAIFYPLTFVILFSSFSQALSWCISPRFPHLSNWIFLTVWIK